MSSVRVLVGTRKGAFILTADGRRKDWEIDGPHFGGWEMYHLKGSPVDPDRIYASQSSGWFGQMVQRTRRRRQDLAAGGQQVRLRRHARHAHVVRRHAASLGVQARLAFRAVARPTPIRSTRAWKTPRSSARPTAGKSWQEMAGLRGHGTGPKWQPGAAACACIRSCSIQKIRERMYIAISAAGAFRTDDGGESWRPINRGLQSQYIPDPTAEVGHCVHRIAMHPRGPACSSCRSTGT